MIGKYSSISFFGNWDFNSKKSNPDSYQQLRCSQLKDNQLYCGNIIINLNNGIGKIGPNRQFNIRKSFFIDNGYIIRENNYNNKNGYYLELLMRNNNIFSIYIINDRLFRSNFNQQYILGKVDTRYFKEVYNNFPFARLFKVIKP
jgi:dolichyl-diphosphooligosaccharide--protein glycosyltransferase